MTARARTSPSFGKRVFFWGFLLLGAVMLFFVLLVLIAPKAINREAVRSRIEATISKELGGTVTYDRVELVLIPRPKIEFRNLKIEIPVTASVSIAAAKIYARLFPLLQGRFDVSSVTLDRPALALVLPDTGARSSKRTIQKTPPTDRTVSSVLAVASRKMPDFSIAISRGTLSLVREGRRVLSLADLDAVLAFVPGPQEGPGRSGRASDDQYHITGKAQAVISGTVALPGPLRISIARFDAYPKNLVVAQSRARLLDMDMTLSGSVEDYLSAAPRSNIVFSGSIGQDTSVWIRTLAGLPEAVMIRAPIKVRDVRLRSSGTGSSSSLSLAGSVTAKDGAAISFALRYEPDLLAVERLQVKDRESDAVLRLTSGKKDLDLAFNGTLTGDTLSRIVDREHMPFKRITGDIHVHLPRDRWSETAAEGTLEGEGLIIPSPLTASFTVDRFSTRYHGSTVDLRPVVLSLGQDILTLEGTASLSRTGVAVDLDVSADRIDMASLQELAKEKKTESKSIATPSAERKLSVEGDLRLRATAVTFPSYTVNAVAMTLSKTGDQITADLEHASLCGIDLDGTLRTLDHEIEISLAPRVRGGKLDEVLPCILHEDLRITGTYDLSGRFTSRGSWDTILRSLQGNLDFTAKQGRIQSDTIVKSVIAYLNSTSLLKGSRSSLLKEGVPYETFTIRVSIREGVVTVSEGVLKSRDMHITAEGNVDLRKDTLALNVLAAPFTTMDQLLSKIPIVKHLAGSALIVVPVRVEGTFHEPKVKPLPVSGVGTNVTNLMKNIVQAPVKIIEPVLPRELEKGLEPGKEQP
jgi:uncharacterized protein involved in outer membrane biogenesis